MKKFPFIMLIGISQCLSAQTYKQIEKIDPDLVVEARKLLCQGKMNEAIISYSDLIECEKALRSAGRSVDGNHVAEYAYVLALNGFYDGALVNIDLARNLHASTADFFTGQILKVMGYDELAQGFDSKATPPDWIAGSYQVLYDRFRSAASIDVSDYSASLQRANTLSSSGQDIQALVILESLGRQFPKYYLPWVSQSALWEIFENVSYAAKTLSTGLSLYSEDGSEKRKVYADHLSSLEQQLYAIGSSKWKSFLNKYEPRPMLYVGGSAGKGFFSINSRLGVYTNNNISLSANIGYAYSGSSSFSIGLSGYKTWGVFLAGFGISDSVSKDSNTFSVSPLAGLSFLDKSGNSSYDITLSLDLSFSKGAHLGYTLSFGRTFYFDFKGFKK